MSVSSKSAGRKGDLKVSRSEEYDQERFPTKGRVDFVRFQGTIYPAIKGYSKLEAEIHWKQIVSLIKGSVEAIIQGKDLSREQYLDEKIFPYRRCHLNQKERRDVYGLYLRYKIMQDEEDLWDDVDKANSLQSEKPLKLKQPKIRNYKRTPEFSFFYCFF